MKKAGIIVAALLIGLQAVNVQASDDTGASTSVYMMVTYANSITPQGNDTFVITYRDMDTNDTATIEFDASVLNGKAGGMNIEYGAYEITDIKYTGQNQQIKAEGYAVNATFNADSFDPGSFDVGIGSDAVENMKRTNTSLLVVVNDEVSTYTTASDAAQGDISSNMEESMTEQTKNDPGASETLESTSGESTGQSEVVENDTYVDDYKPLDGSQQTAAPASQDQRGQKTEVNASESYEKPKTDEYKPSARSLFLRGLPALIVGAIGALAIFIIHKKGIL